MLLFAQDGGGGAAAGAAGGIAVMILMLFAVIGLVLAGGWMMFAKAGKPGWAIIVPIYNWIVILEIAGKPIWWILLLLIPCVNVIVMLLIWIDVAKAFGQGAGFGIGLLLLSPIFIPILGFGSAKYIGPQAS